MKVTGTKIELQSHITRTKLSPVGFVPTMGALHEGHISLVKSAVTQCPIVVVSIYVNPNQFNDKNDLINYPRTLDSDLKMLDKALRKDDVVFTPDTNEIYPEEDKRKFSFGSLDIVMEALHRPGHFNGVAQVVSRLFDIVKPDIALFGEKDFQQLAVIRELVRQTGNKVKITGCPIIREKDGLAMSSRNNLLEPEIRKKAGIIYKTLTSASQMFRLSDIPEIKSYVEKNINKIHGFEIEYFEIVNDKDLIPVHKKSNMKEGYRYFGCIAVKAGRIRLIDNIEIRLV